MTVDDAFDARLRAAFQAAEPKDDAEAYAQALTARLERSARVRLCLVGGAGALGAAVASAQLGALQGLLSSAGGVLTQLGDDAARSSYSPAEIVAALALAALGMAFALTLPSRS